MGAGSILPAQSSTVQGDTGCMKERRQGESADWLERPCLPKVSASCGLIIIIMEGAVGMVGRSDRQACWRQPWVRAETWSEAAAPDRDLSRCNNNELWEQSITGFHVDTLCPTGKGEGSSEVGRHPGHPACASPPRAVSLGCGKTRTAKVVAIRFGQQHVRNTDNETRFRFTTIRKIVHAAHKGWKTRQRSSKKIAGCKMKVSRSSVNNAASSWQTTRSCDVYTTERTRKETRRRRGDSRGSGRGRGVGRGEGSGIGESMYVKRVKKNVHLRKVEGAHIRLEGVRRVVVPAVVPRERAPAVVVVVVVGLDSAVPVVALLAPLGVTRVLCVRRVRAVVAVHAFSVVVAGPVAPHHPERAVPPEDVRMRALRRQRRVHSVDTVACKLAEGGVADGDLVRLREPLPGVVVPVRVSEEQCIGLALVPVAAVVVTNDEVVARAAAEGVVVEVALVQHPVVVHPPPVVDGAVEAVRDVDTRVLDARVRGLPHRHSRADRLAGHKIVAVVAVQRVGHGTAGGLVHPEAVLLLVALEVVRPVEVAAAVRARVELVLRVQEPVPQQPLQVLHVLVELVVNVVQSLVRRDVVRRALERVHSHHRVVADNRVRTLTAVRHVVTEVRERQPVPLPPPPQVPLAERAARRELEDVRVCLVLQLVQQLVERVVVVDARVRVRVRVRAPPAVRQLRVRAAVVSLVHNHVCVAGDDVNAVVAVEHVVREVQRVVRGVLGLAARQVQVVHDSVVRLVHVVQGVEGKDVEVAEQQHQVLCHHVQVFAVERVVVLKAHVTLHSVARKRVVAGAAVQDVVSAVQLRRVVQSTLLRLVRVQVRRQQRQAELHVDPPGDGGFAQRLQLRHVHVHERVVHGKVTDKHVVAVTTRQLIVAVQLLLVADRVGHDRRERLHRRRHRSVRARQVLGTNRTEHQQVVVADHRADCGVLQHPHGTRTRRLLRQHIERHADHSAEEVDVQRRHGLGRREQTDRLRHQRHRRVVVVRAR
eukprot:Rhum_TRINITY_DN15426_c0_g1::Rhum_TRINITY_DN15426_c0_g1_i7::g.155097::m.155097